MIKMNNIEKPKSFEDLLKLQKILDEEVEKSRKNNFIPREREELDILLSIDDEFQEWLKELPKIYNFKTWKQKEYDIEKELEELTDILFFFLQYFNEIENNTDNVLIFNSFKEGEETVKEEIYNFKFNLWVVEIQFAFKNYISLVNKRGFTKEEILNTYWKKWQKNMKRINKDWTL